MKLIIDNRENKSKLKICFAEQIEIVKYNMTGFGFRDEDIRVLNYGDEISAIPRENARTLVIKSSAVCFLDGMCDALCERKSYVGSIILRDTDNQGGNEGAVYGIFSDSPEDVQAFLFGDMGKFADCGVFDTDDAVLYGSIDFRMKNAQINERILAGHEKNGVVILSSDGVIISPKVKIGTGTVIYPGTILYGATVIGERCEIGANTRIEDTIVGNDTVLNSVQAYQSEIGNNVKIGPFCHIRPNSKICDGVKIGDFVEVKNSTLGKDSHASHLAYIGDSDVGERVNFSCGAITSNYDGIRKARCKIGDDAFVGCNVNLVAPVTLADKAYIAAGSTITKDVPEDSLAVARVKETRIIENWSARRKK